MKKSRNSLLILITVIYCGILHSQTPTLENIFSIGGDGFDNICDIELFGNELFFTGYFQGNVTIGDISIESNGDTDILFGKLDDLGEPVWIKNFGSCFKKPFTITETGSSLAIDKSGSCYLLAQFTSDAIVKDTIVSSKGQNDFLLAKFNTDGDLQWIQTGGGPNQDIAYSVKCDELNNVYICGFIQSCAFIGSHLITSQNGKDAFIAKYSKEGVLIWHKIVSSSSNSIIKDFDFNQSGDIIATGKFSGTILRDNQQLSSDEECNFIMKINSNGIISHLNKSLSNHFANNMIIDKNDNIILSGFKLSKKVNKKQKDISIIKYNSSLELIWDKSIGQKENEEVFGVTCDLSNNIYVSGYFTNRIHIGGSKIESNGFSDAILLQLNSDGNIQSFSTFGDYSQDIAYDIELSASNGVIVSGSFNGIINDGEIKSNGKSDAVIMKYDIGNSGSQYFKSNSLSIESNSNETLSLWPNPASDNITISIKGTINRISITDVSGRVLLVKDINTENEYTLDISSFKEGAYILKVYSNDKTYKSKFVKE